MKRILIALAALCFASGMAHAQTAAVVASCGSITYDAGGAPKPITQDANGNLCTGAVLTGGGDASAANQASQITQETAINTVTGVKGDAKSTATDTTAITIMQVLKEISAMVQAPPSQAVTNAGTFATQDTQSGTWTVQPGNTANTTPWLVSEQPATAGGLSVASFIVVNNTTSLAVKSSAGQAYSVSGFSNSSTIAYVKLYNIAQGSNTCGSNTPVWRGMIPGQTGGAGFVIPIPEGVAFGTAISACVTTGIADNDTTAPAASTYLLNIGYK